MLAAPALFADGRLTLNFNPGWKFIKADPAGATAIGFDEHGWESVSLPHTYNDTDTFDNFSLPGHRGEQDQWGGRTWYRKTFSLPENFKGKKVYIEFAAARQVAEVYLNGKLLGVSKTGFIPFGFDLTPLLRFDVPNVLAVMCDNRFMKDPLAAEGAEIPALRLARYTGGGTLPVGTLNIFGGMVTGDGDIVAGGGTSTIAISNGVLAVTGVVGTPAAPIGKVALTNATLQFSVDTVATNLVAATLTTGGSSNVINILSLPSVSVPTQVTLVEYTNAIGGAGFNFVLGSLVSGGGFSGYLSNNVANSSVDLAFVSLPAAPPGFRTVKLSGTNFIVSGTNGIPGWPCFILVSTNVALPLNQWTSMATNQFDAGGNFTFTNRVSPGPPQKFYLLKLP